MNIGFKTVSGFGLATLFLAGQASAQEPVSPSGITNKTEKVSYAVGMSIAMQIKRVGFEVDADVVGQAIKDVLAGREPKLSEAEVQQTLMTYQQELRAKREESRIQLAEKNRKAGAAFLAANRTKAGVKTETIKLSDTNNVELQYKVVTAGKGDIPKAGDTVTFTMRGTTIDGTEFDSTAKRGGQPLRTAVNTVFPHGLSQALQKMPVGSKWTIYLPPTLAYGDFGNGTQVEPGSTLVYDVELLSDESPQPLTSDIIEVPSAEQMKAGKSIRVIKADELKAMQTNAPAKSKP